MNVLWVCLHRPSDDGSSRSRPNCLCRPLRLHVPITEKTTVSNLNIMHFSCIVSLCYKNLHTHTHTHTCQAIHSAVILHYTFVWAAVAGNIITNSTVYFLMNVCGCFVMVFKLYVFSAVTHTRRRWGMVMAWRLATLPMSCYIVRKITTRSVPKSCTCYLSSSQSLVALWFYVSREFRFCCSNLW